MVVSFGHGGLSTQKATDRSREALIAIRQIIRATEINARNLAKDTGLTNSQLLVMRILRGEELTPGTVAAKVGLTQATVTALIDRLVARGFVHRRRGEADRRKVWLTLTRTGEDVLRSMPTDIQNSFQRAFASLDGWEQAMLVASLERVVAMLGAQGIPAGPTLELGELSGTESA